MGVRRNPRVYCVLTTQRSGSTWFLQLLGEHPDVRAFGEVLLNKPVAASPGALPELQPDQRFVEFPRRRLELEVLAFRRYVQHLGSLAHGKKVAIFKIMYGHLSLPRLFILAALRVPIVHLIRENPLEVALSRKVMNDLGTAHVREDVAVPPRVHVDVGDVVARMRKHRMHTLCVAFFLRAWPATVTRITYDDLRANNELVVNSVLISMGLRPARTSTTGQRLRKIVLRKPSDFVENFDELSAALIKNGYGRYLEVLEA